MTWYNPIKQIKDNKDDLKELDYNSIGALILTLIIITPLVWLLQLIESLESRLRRC